MHAPKKPQSPDVSPESDDPNGVAGRYNFVVLIIYQVVLRIGWIFKTESVIMPAVLDSLGGPGWLRGCLPMLNRFGQSITPLLIARQVKIAPRKKWSQFFSSAVMGLVFAALAAIWHFGGARGADQSQAVALAAVFLLLYAIFFMANGANQLSLNTLLGKLIVPTSRGRMMLLANVLGSVFAVTAAAIFLPRWLEPGQVDFRWVFGTSALFFTVAAATSMLLREPPDSYEQPRSPITQKFRDAYNTLAGDANFRRLALVAVLFDSSVMLFPHYQALARSDRVQLDMTNIMQWVVAQNIGTALFSLLGGPLADRMGNRMVLRVLVLAICCAPALAIGLSHAQSLSPHWFLLVFVLVGMTPVVIRTLQHYTLEVAPPSEHPRYLSSLSLCLVLPILLSPLVGKLIDRVGFDPVFLGIAALVLVGWLTTFQLDEPRHAHLVLDGSDDDTLDEFE